MDKWILNGLAKLILSPFLNPKVGKSTFMVKLNTSKTYIKFKLRHQNDGIRVIRTDNSPFLIVVVSLGISVLVVVS